MSAPVVLGFPDYAEAGQRLAAALDWAYHEVGVHRFPDGESLVHLPESLPSKVVLCRSLDHPNTKLVELGLSAATARELGASRLTLVAPYLCYMRQDIAFRPGEAVSQRIVGQWLAQQFDAVVTVDPHLHRVHRLDEVLPGIQAVASPAAPLMAEFLARRGEHPFLLGPDLESRQWVEEIAARAGLEFGVASKRRSGDREVAIELPEHDFSGRYVALIDDIASTGFTLAATAKALRAAGAQRVDCLVTHALFNEGALTVLGRAGVTHVWSTDSVAHASNAIPLAGLLASATRAALDALVPASV